MENGNKVEMKVEGLTLDPITNMPIIILKDGKGEKVLPIWVGVFEANAIALEMEKISTPRPMTHDLIKNIVNGLDAEINHVCVSDLKDNTFYAVISVRINGRDVDIDSRPSDAIAVALRFKAPILVAQKVLDEARSFDITNEGNLGDSDRWNNWLKNVKPGDFGNIDQ